MKINQWANVVRWEMRTRLFLRTTEFLWQEGHTAHADEKEAREETLTMLQEYRTLAEDFLALYVFPGEKSEGERFAGACDTYTLEMMVQDRKAIQSCTSHYLGQNFSKAFDIHFNTKQGDVQHVHTTSWGMSTRMMGALIMAHGDDDGLRLPPTIAPHQIVIIPITPDETKAEQVCAYAKFLKEQLSKSSFAQIPLRVHVDERDMRGGEKMWEWVKKGVPLLVEVGPRDVEKQEVVFRLRTDSDLKKMTMSKTSFIQEAAVLLEQVQKTLFEQMKAYSTQHVYSGFSDFQDLVRFFTPKNEEKPEIHGGFALVKWCKDPKTEEMLKEFKLSIRCIPFEQSGTEGRCILTGRPATCDVLIAKSY